MFMLEDFPILPEEEREKWIEFHRQAYKEDIEVAEKLVLVSPRWCVVSGYYAMHDITKLYLGKIHKIKISGENIHRKAVDALKLALKENEDREKVFSLLKKAEETYEIFKNPRIGTLSFVLIRGKNERGKAQYYTPYTTPFNKEFFQKAIEFLEKVVKAYVDTIKNLAGE